MSEATGSLTLAQTVRRFAADWRRYKDYVFYTAKAELRAEVANAYLDWLWWVLEPLCLMVVYTIIFGVIFQVSEPYFPAFVMSGIAMWRFFNLSVHDSATLVKNRKMVVTRIYVPKQMILLVYLLRCAYKSLFSFIIVFAMMVFYGISPSFSMLMLVPGYILLFLVTYVVSCLVMHIGVFVEDMPYIVNVGLTMLMYFTGTFWSIENRVPAPFGVWLMRANPVAHAISLARNGLLYNTISLHWTYFAWIAVLLFLAVVVTRLIYQNENTYVKVI